MLNPDKESENKVLGIPWNTKNDEFVISFRIQKSTEVVETKIDLLKRIASSNDLLEAVINSRPVVSICEDQVEEVLTPSHLYCERWLLDKQNNESSDEDITEIKTLEKIQQKDGDIWIKLEIDFRERFLEKKSLKINVGDAVSITEEGLKRRHWKVGKVLRIIKGKDDVLRGAVVQIFNGKNGKETISTPLPKLYLLEIRPERERERERERWWTTTRHKWF